MSRAPSNLRANLTGKRVGWILAALTLTVLIFKVLYPLAFERYVGESNPKLVYASSQLKTLEEFEAIARELTQKAREPRAFQMVSEDQDSFARQVKMEILANTNSFMRDTDYPHIKYFRDRGILRYEGPRTCLACHSTMSVDRSDGTRASVDTLDELVNSVHFKFQSDTDGFSTYGYDGRVVNGPGTRKIPVGKIDRACGIPGSFSWTGWAALVDSKPEHKQGAIEVRSEGCGQCHIGGNYHPATEKMMSVGDVPENAKDGIDCLICHAVEYDMNQRYAFRDAGGVRWNQDRSLRAALTVKHSANAACLRCHQHNMGGDAYPHNEAAKALGYQNRRLLHSGAKRGNPFAPPDDAHAAANILCTDCHVPEGHKIPRGRVGVDLVANDLPDKEVSCESCHSRAPHNNSDLKALLNGHIARLACETCHIKSLQDNNVVLRDWVHPTWDAKEGIYAPTDIYRSGKVGQGFVYLWFNGNGTFLANALGSNPDGSGDYNPLMNQLVRISDPDALASIRAATQSLKRAYPEIDVEAYIRTATDPLSQLSPEMLRAREEAIRKNLSVAMSSGTSRIYPFKIFNALMYEDMNNRGPFGAMILPFDYKIYYETGNTRNSVAQAIRHPIVVRMYQEPFKLYMMDEMMSYFGVAGGWNATYPLVDGKLGNVEPHWMRQMGSLMVNHGIKKDAWGCADCHRQGGIMDFAALGYTPERAHELRSLEIPKQP
jgi:hypothetical protein